MKPCNRITLAVLSLLVSSAIISNHSERYASQEYQGKQDALEKKKADQKKRSRR